MESLLAPATQKFARRQGRSLRHGMTSLLPLICRADVDAGRATDPRRITRLRRVGFSLPSTIRRQMARRRANAPGPAQ